MKGNWYWREAFSLPWLSKEKVDLSGYCFWGNEFSWTGSTAVDFTGHPFLGPISRSTGSECIPFVVRLQMDFSNDGLLADHHWYFELVLFVWPKYLEDIFVLISGPNAKQNAYTWNIPHFKRVITWISLDIEHLYSSKLEKKNNRRQTTNNSS